MISRENKIEKFGGLVVGLLMSPFDGGASAAAAAAGAVATLVGSPQPLPKAYRLAVKGIGDALQGNPDFHDSDWVDAEALLNRCALTRDDLVKHHANPDALHRLILDRLSIRGQSGGDRLFDLILGGALRQVCNDRSVLDDIQPYLIRDMVQTLHNLKDASLPELQQVAAAFHIEGIEDYSPPGLRKLLENKARDYDRLRAQVAGMDDRTAALANLKAAASDAIDRLDFAEAERLLARVDDMETERAAQTKELRAQVVLMMGDAEAAYRHLTAAAESFGGIGQDQVRRRRNNYAKMLYDHGLRYGGRGLEWAAKMWRDNLARLDESCDAEDWAMTQNNLGAALSDQGSRTAGPEGAALLADAVAAYRAALRVTTEADQPLDWAGTLTNLGNALQVQGSRTAGPEGAALLADAVAAYRAALRVYTEADQPLNWAMTQNNLGTALSDQGSRTAGPERAALLADAVAAYRAALRVRIEADQPLKWAGTLTNLGNALQVQGSRTAGPEGAALLADAVAAYRAALRVRTEADQPLNWAMTQENLALAREAIARHDSTPDPTPHLRAALDHVDQALRVYDPDHLGFYHDKATRLRDRLRAALRDHAD